MKYRKTLMAVIATIFAATPLVLFAQGMPGGPGGGCGFHHGPGGFDGGPGGGPLGVVHRLLNRLDLTDEQQSQIDTILDQELPAIDDLRDRARTARQEFHDGHGIGEFDEATYRAFFEAQTALEIEIRMASARTVSQVWAVLTPEQQQEATDLLETARSYGGKKMGGRRMHR